MGRSNSDIQDAYDLLSALSDVELQDCADIPEGLLRWCPSEPWPKQQEFLNLDHVREVFYGGAAAGGKSESLLMAALKYVHVPGYSALILRKDFSRLNLSGGLIPRSQGWMLGKGPVWNGGTKRWTFPSGATLSFGHVLTTLDKFRYGSSEYQYIAWDELTEFNEADYTYLFSRLRKTTDLDVPLRMRSASNPGGIGHDWVKRRFTTRESIAALQDGRSGVFYTDSGAAFVPARIRDNPSIDEAEYSETLAHLDDVTRARLMNGDWSVREDALIRPDRVRRYVLKGAAYQTMDHLGNQGARIVVADCRRFAVIDTAGTSEQKAKEDRGKEHSYSVCSTWDYHPPTRFMFLVHVWRERVEWENLVPGVKSAITESKSPLALIENAHYGQPLAGELKGFVRTQLVGPVLPGMTGAGAGKGGAKKERAVASGLFTKLQAGEVYLPLLGAIPGSTRWLEEYEGEIFSWTGSPDQMSDQVDTTSYAAHHVGGQSKGWGGVVDSRQIGGMMRW